MRTLVSAPLLFMLTLGLAGCGGSSSTPPSSSPQTPPTTLTGNWLLSGSRVHAAYPVVSTSLHVDGNVVTGEASVASQCTIGMFSGTSTGTLPIKGTIANDGTFQASETLVGPTGSSFSLSISGSSPASTAPSVWTGNYSLVVTPPGGGCATSQSAAFTAAAIAPVTGTYIGVPANPGTFPEPFGSNATVSLQITQGTPTPITRGSTGTYYPIPLTASLTIANSPCSFSGSTTASTIPGSLAGDRLSLPFVTSGAPGEPFVSGTLDDPTAASFLGDLTILATGNGCSGIALYEFTRK